MTTVIKHTLRAGATTTGSIRPDGWSPSLRVTLLGPTPAAAQLLWSVDQPNGEPWFEQRVRLPELAASETTVVDLRRQVDGEDLPGAGTVGFSLRLRSDLDGVDELLHRGSLSAVALEGEQRFAIDGGWMLRLGFVSLDAIDEYDAPRLTVTTFVEGEIDAYRLEAHCIHDGQRLSSADVSVLGASTANDGARALTEVVAVFDGVRGWNNLRDTGWGSGWHLLDEHDGRYEVKLLCDAAVVRTVPFEVAGRLLVAPGRVEFDPGRGAVILVPAQVPATETETDGVTESEEDAPGAFFGDAETAGSWVDVTDVYARRVAPTVAPPPMFDETTSAALQRFVDRAERLLLTWEAGMAAPPPFDFGQVLQAEAVLAEREEYATLADGAAAVPDDHPAALAGAATTFGDLRRRMTALFAAADARITGAAQATDDELAPYRTLLTGDKLAVFDEHPANAFLYTTTDRRVIETPEEIAGAEYWYFEGPIDLPSTASVNGVAMKVTVQGWRVLGWRFDASGSIVEEFENQGPGSSAPKWAFQRE